MIKTMYIASGIGKDQFNKEHRQSIKLEDTRRNIITEGVDLNALVGKEFKVGEVTLRGIELCEPCSTLGSRLSNDEITDVAVVKAFTSRAGLRVDVLSDGVLSVGDKFHQLLD